MTGTNGEVRYVRSGSGTVHRQVRSGEAWASAEGDNLDDADLTEVQTHTLADAPDWCERCFPAQPEDTE